MKREKQSYPEKFILWLLVDNIFDQTQRSSTEIAFWDDDKEIYLTLNEVYEYWGKNIKK